MTRSSRTIRTLVQQLSGTRVRPARPNLTVEQVAHAIAEYQGRKV